MLKKTLISSVAAVAIIASGGIAAAQQGQRGVETGAGAGAGAQAQTQERQTQERQTQERQTQERQTQERQTQQPTTRGPDRAQTQTQQPPQQRGLDRARERAAEPAQQRGLERAQERAAPAAGGEGRTGQRTGDQQRDRKDQRQQTGDQQRDRKDQRQQTGDQQRDRQDRQQTGRDQREDRTTTGQVPRVELAEKQRRELRRQFREVNIRTVPRNRINVNLVIGAVLPSTIDYYPLPGPILSIVPQFRGYHAIQVGDQILIVEPVTRRVVYIIEI